MNSTAIITSEDCFLSQEMDHDCFGFIFAFKVYQHKNSNNKIKENFVCEDYEHYSDGGGGGGGNNRGRFVDCLENLVHKITHSDIIHVEIIPVLGFDNINKELKISRIAYSAYIGLGFDEHESTFCISDPTYKLVYIPMPFETMHLGVDYLHSQRGKQYNYFALPLTVLPSWCKKRKTIVYEPSFYYESYAAPMEASSDNISKNAHADNILLSAPKVFCSQLGLTLCYLCNVFPSTYDFSTAFAHKKKKKSHWKKSAVPFFIDPMCCTPAELYNLLINDGSHHQPIGILWPQDYIVIQDEY